MNENVDVVKPGDYVIVEKQNYRKLSKVTENGVLSLGKERIELGGIIEKPYWTTFRMVQSKRDKKLFALEVTPRAETSLVIKKTLTSGIDNRTIMDDGKSQKLSKEEIEDLRESGKSSNEILESLIVNSKSFAAKTEYSQDKYIKKKEKKYYRYLTIRKPSVDQLSEIYYKKDHARISCLRADTLAQILSYCDVKASGSYLLYDSGSMGLPASAMLNRIGCDTEGLLIHLHPGNQPQSTLVQAMNYPREQLERLISANLYSFLRLHYRGESSIMEEIALKNCVSESRKNGVDVIATERRSTEAEDSLKSEDIKRSDEATGDDVNRKRKLPEEEKEEIAAKKPKWLLETGRAVELCADMKIDGLVIVAKEHPLAIVKALLQFLGSSRPFVIYHCYREPLQETYVALKQRGDIANLRLFNNFFRSYQVLPNRTHPDILTSDLGGYILTGYRLD